ncbi:MAG: ArsR family transcriptional regulator [Haloglomus sp.]
MSTGEGDGGDGIAVEAPADAFALVANDQRFEMLTALWTAQQEGETPLAFSEFHDRVGMRDSGQFNYHLDKLTPRFVRQTEDGYALTFAGQQMIGAAVSGTYTEPDVAVGPVSVGGCPQCEATLEARYEAGRVVIDCPDCGTTVTDWLSAPPVLAAHHDPEELPAVFERLLRTQTTVMTQGFCPVCGGPIESTPVVFLDREHGFDFDDPRAARNNILQRCHACGNESYSVIGTAVLHHPAVVSFLYDHGVAVHETPLWEHDWLSDDHAAVRSESPPRVRVTVEADDATMSVTLDDDCDVVSVPEEGQG